MRKNVKTVLLTFIFIKPSDTFATMPRNHQLNNFALYKEHYLFVADTSHVFICIRYADSLGS